MDGLTTKKFGNREKRKRKTQLQHRDKECKKEDKNVNGNEEREERPEEDEESRRCFLNGNDLSAGPKKVKKNHVRERIANTSYDSARLNQEQKEIFNYMHVNRHNPNGNIVLVQAGPGTGKTFTMLSLTVTWASPVEVIIFKNDLLNIFSKCGASTMSVTRFLMEAFDLSYMQYRSFEVQLNKNVSVYDFILIFVGLLRNFKCLKRNAFYIFDEYTFISKPMLLIILMYLKIYKRNAIFCGDKNQLQSIRKCNHLLSSSFDIVHNFADKVFELNKNERCKDADYDAEIKYVSQFINDKTIESQPFMMVLCSNLFHDKIINRSKMTDTVLGFRHRQIAQEIHSWFTNNDFDASKVLCSFYYIVTEVGEDENNVNGERVEKSNVFVPKAWLEYKEKNFQVDKFLPYVPLIEGNYYFYQTFSEYSVVLLKKILNSEEVVIELNNGQEKIVGKVKCNDVLFTEHKEFLLGRGKGYLYNFDLYPSFYMSIHMCQGRTIRNVISVSLEHATNRALYVAISRVSDKNQINRISLPKSLFLSASTIYNYPQLCESNRLKLSDIRQKLEIDGYRYLYSGSVFNQNDIQNEILNFYATNDPKRKVECRAKLCGLIEKWKIEVITINEIPTA